MFNFLKSVFRSSKKETDNNLSQTEVVNLTSGDIDVNTSIVSEPSVETKLNQQTKEIVIQVEHSIAEPDLSNYHYPTLDLLKDYSYEKSIHDISQLEIMKDSLVSIFKVYNIGLQRISATIGPSVTLFEIAIGSGVRVSQVRNLENDIMLNLAVDDVRVIAPLPGKGTIGIEVPNKQRLTVGLKVLLTSENFINTKYYLPAAIGKKLNSDNFYLDIALSSNILIGGATGQGKSVLLNIIITSLLYKKHPSQIKFVLMDFHRLEFGFYRLLEKHFLAKVSTEDELIITQPNKVSKTLNSLCILMDKRYEMLQNAKCHDIREYNEKFINRQLEPNSTNEFLPSVILIINELDEFIHSNKNEIEPPLERLTKFGTRIGVYCIISTQRPSADVMSGSIKSNFLTRIAFKTASRIDSDIIIEQTGAEKLNGKGDLLLNHNGEIIRLQCPFIDSSEIESVCNFISKQQGYLNSYFLPDELDIYEPEFDLSSRDPLFEEAARLIVRNQMGSTSLLQRRMKLGYNRAGSLMDQLEQAGVVGPNLGSKARDVLIKNERELQEILDLLN